MESYRICLLVTGLCHFTQCPQSSAMWLNGLSFVTLCTPGSTPSQSWPGGRSPPGTALPSRSLQTGGLEVWKECSAMQCDGVDCGFILSCSLQGMETFVTCILCTKQKEVLEIKENIANLLLFKCTKITLTLYWRVVYIQKRVHI